MIYKYKVWNGREMVSPDYITRNGIAFWKEDSIQCSSPKIVQFTGLRDRKRTVEYPNGQEIYEGDIIKYGVIYEWGPCEDYGYIYYAVDRAMFYITKKNKEQFNMCAITHKTINGKNRIFEVIGNIYANPELLES